MKVIILVSLFCLALVSSQSNCGGNCPSGACLNCPCGYSSNYVGEGTFAGYLSSVGLDTQTFTCIANAESSFNANAMNQNGANMAVGVLQVTDDNGFSDSTLCDPYGNAKAAAALYQECGICAWLDDASCFDTSCCGGSYCNSACTVGGGSTSGSSTSGSSGSSTSGTSGSLAF